MGQSNLKSRDEPGKKFIAITTAWFYSPTHAAKSHLPTSESNDQNWMSFYLKKKKKGLFLVLPI